MSEWLILWVPQRLVSSSACILLRFGGLAWPIPCSSQLGLCLWLKFGMLVDSTCAFSWITLICHWLGCIHSAQDVLVLLDEIAVLCKDVVLWRDARLSSCFVCSQCGNPLLYTSSRECFSTPHEFNLLPAASVAWGSQPFIWRCRVLLSFVCCAQRGRCC